MTTIVFRDGILAADRAIFDRETYCGETLKIFRSECGAIGGLAGFMGDSATFRDWMAAPGGIAIDQPPEFQHQDSEALVITKAGDCYWIGPGKRWAKQLAEYHVIGSGFRIAMGALAAGVSAEQAVKIACDLDTYTRGPVDLLTQGEG